MELSSGEIVILVHQEHATGEPGDPISAEVQRIIHAQAAFGYGVVDFGERQGNAQELWFQRVSLPEACHMADSFIRRGGDV